MPRSDRWSEEQSRRAIEANNERLKQLGPTGRADPLAGADSAGWSKTPTGYLLVPPSVLEDAKRFDEALKQVSRSLGRSASLTIEEMAEAMRAVGSAGGEPMPAVAKADPRLEWFEPPKYRKTRGRLRYGARLENLTSRKAEYTITVTEVRDPVAKKTKFVLERSYGPIGAPGHNDIVSTSEDMSAALHEARTIHRAKSSRDYREVQLYEDLADEPAVVADSDPSDWTVTDDDILPAGLYEDSRKSAVEAVEPKERPKPPVRDCDCVNLFSEIAANYMDVIEGTPEVAPRLQAPDSVMFALPKHIGARWLVGIYAACAPEYDHARAIPVGPPMDDDKLDPLYRRNKAEWVEDVVLKHLRPAHTRRLKSFGLLVEEAEVDLLALDLWFGQVDEKAFRDSDGEMLNIIESDDFRTRRSFLTEAWSNTFTPSDALRLAELKIARLREEFLANEGDVRFELTDQSRPLPLISVRLPILT